MNLKENCLEGEIFMVLEVLLDFRFLRMILSRNIHLSPSPTLLHSDLLHVV